MVKKHYQVAVADDKKIAKAIAKNQPVSVKYSTELCREIKGKPVAKAEQMLERIINMEEFLPLRKFNKKVGHRKGDARSSVKSGRYPIKVCKVFRGLLESVKANADFKGLDADSLIITHCFASQGFRRTAFQPKGKISGKKRKRKSAHIEVIVREAK